MKTYAKSLCAMAALFMLTFVSCVDEPAGGGNDELISVDGIATVQEQINSIETSVEDLQDLQTMLESKDYSLEGAIQALEDHVASLKAGAPLLEGTLATLEQQKNLAAEIGALQARLADDSKLDKEFYALEKGVAKWIGKNFNAFYPLATAEAKAHALLADFAEQIDDQKLYVDAVSSDVEAGLREGVALDELTALYASVVKNEQDADKLGSSLASAAEELEQNYIQVLTSAVSEREAIDGAALAKLNQAAQAQTLDVDNTLAGLINRVAKVEAELDDIKTRLGELRDGVEDLLSMIQSLTFMSNYATDYAYAPYSLDTENKVSDPGKSYYNCGVRTPGADIELNFIVRPAAAATALTTETVGILGYYADAIQTRAIDPSKFIDFTIKSVSVTNEERGIVTVTMANNLTPDFYYKAIGAKLSLTVKADPSEIASKFIELHPLDNSGRVYVESVVPSEKVLTIKKGERTTLTATVNPSNAYNKALQWLSTDTKIVRIDESTGELEAYGVGTANVQIVSRGTDEWGRSVLAECKVVVTEAITLVGPPYVEVDKTAELTLDYPAGLLVESKQWWTSDSAIATVDKEGVVTGVEHTYLPASHDYGTITVYCQINGETTVSWDMKVVVTQPREIVFSNVDNNTNAFTIKLDQSLDLSATINPEVPAEQFRILYSTMEYVNYMNGTVLNAYNSNLPIGTGYVTVKVDNVHGENYMGSRTNVSRQIAVTVEPYYVKEIELSDLNLNLNSTATLSPTIISDGGAGKAPTNPTLTWSSSDPEVATVDQNGFVTTKSVGQTTITAAATDGSGVVGSCIVDVSMPWKEFEVGQFVFKNKEGEIEFSESAYLSSETTLVGIVIAKVNPRVSDKKLPETCTHGIAIGLNRTKDAYWWKTYHTEQPQSLAKYVEMYPEEGYVNTAGVSFTYALVINDIGKRPSGYTNTLLLRHYIDKYGLSMSGDLISQLDSYTTELPSGTSGWYIPSIYEMNMIYQAYLNNGLDTSLWQGGGTQLDSKYHWTVSEIEGNTYSNAAAMHPKTGEILSKIKTSYGDRPYVRYVFAF